MLGIACSFKRKRQTEDGWKLTSAAPPPDVVAAVASRGEWASIRRLSGIVECPVLRPDGSVLLAPGYDAATAYIYEPSALVEVPEQPTLEDARAAVAVLLDLVGDFPFGTGAHRAAWLAGLLTLLARPAIDGPVPLLLIDANERGAGKSLLADVIGVIVRGQPLPRRTAPDDPAEWRKVVLAIGIAGDAAVLIDNVTRTLKSDALDAVLTGTAFRERLLGKNEELSLDVRTMFIVTANNAALSADLVRRSLQVRLEAQVENPEQRDGWRHPRLLEHVRAHRAVYLAAGLTILRAYVVAGRPEVTMRPMGSFEAWSAVVRAPLIWAGQSDPAETQDALRDGADPERESLEALFGAWHAVYGERAVSVRNVLGNLADPEQSPDEQVLRDAISAFCDCEVTRLPSVKRFGNKLRAVRGRIVRGIILERVKEHGRDGATWRTRRVL
jgi:putative DNA primase/helicase